LTKEMEIVKKNLKIWSHVIPFLNCKLTLRKENARGLIKFINFIYFFKFII
jgi:hypothetical protein